MICGSSRNSSLVPLLCTSNARGGRYRGLSGLSLFVICLLYNGQELPVVVLNICRLNDCVFEASRKIFWWNTYWSKPTYILAFWGMWVHLLQKNPWLEPNGQPKVLNSPRSQEEFLGIANADSQSSVDTVCDDPVVRYDSDLHGSSNRRSFAGLSVLVRLFMRGYWMVTQRCWHGAALYCHRRLVDSILNVVKYQLPWFCFGSQAQCDFPLITTFSR